MIKRFIKKQWNKFTNWLCPFGYQDETGFHYGKEQITYCKQCGQIEKGHICDGEFDEELNK